MLNMLRLMIFVVIILLTHGFVIDLLGNFGSNMRLVMV
jgi:hypothetical protein